MTRDGDAVNRDWATLLLAQQNADTPEVRAALLRAAEDESDTVRAEAVLGVPQRDKALALPLLRSAMARKSISMPILAAAALAADPSLVADLRASPPSPGAALLYRLATVPLTARNTRATPRIYLPDP